jgi:hypothetical protein
MAKHIKQFAIGAEQEGSAFVTVSVTLDECPI